MRALALALLVAVALAGCNGNATPKAIAPSKETGDLHGVVVDEAIRPLAGALVVLTASDGAARNQTTADDGVWAFKDLAPGAYIVRTQRRGYYDGQTEASVTTDGAGASALGVRVVLSVDPAKVPALEQFSFDGYLQCSFTLVALRQACDADEALAPVCTTAPSACPDDLSEDRFLAIHTLGRSNVTFVQSEVQWEASSDLGRALRVVPGARDPASGSIQDFEGVEGPSPLLVPMTGEVANALGIGAGKDLALRTFSSYEPGTQPPCLPSPVGCVWGAGLAVQQRFTIVTHVFYGFTPPAGWQFSVDGLPAIPPP